MSTSETALLVAANEEIFLLKQQLAHYKALEYIIHNPGEPFFVLLGRDPQAPDLVRDWAIHRDLAEPGEPKVSDALRIVKAMQQYKLDHPDIGMSRALWSEKIVPFSC